MPPLAFVVFLKLMPSGSWPRPEQPRLVAQLLQAGDPQADDHQPDFEPLALGQLNGVLAATGKIGHQAEVDPVRLGEVKREGILRLDRHRTELLRNQQAALMNGHSQPSLGDSLGLGEVGYENAGSPDIDLGLADLDVVRLFFAEFSLNQTERLTRNIGAGVCHTLAVPDLLRLEIALRRQHGLSAADELFHQFFGSNPFLGERQGRDVTRRVERQEDVEAIKLGVDKPGLGKKRSAASDVGEYDGLTAGGRSRDSAQPNLELGQVHEWDERLQRLEPRNRGHPD